VHVHFHAQQLAVQRPTLAVGRDVGAPTECGLVGVLGGDRNLERVTRCRLVQGERSQVVQGTSRQVVRVEEVHTGAAPASGVEGREILRYRLDGEACPWQVAEE